MTPKEKAIELVDKYLDLDFEIYFEDAKQCALIAVDEIIKQENAIVPQLILIIQKIMEKRNLKETFKGDVNQFWKDVKQEIEDI